MDNELIGVDVPVGAVQTAKPLHAVDVQHHRMAKAVIRGGGGRRAIRRLYAVHVHTQIVRIAIGIKRQGLTHEAP